MAAKKNEGWKPHPKAKAKHQPTLSLDEKMLTKARKNRERLEKLRATEKPKQAKSAFGTFKMTSSMDKSFLKKKR